MRDRPAVCAPMITEARVELCLLSTVDVAAPAFAPPAASLRFDVAVKRAFGSPKWACLVPGRVGRYQPREQPQTHDRDRRGHDYADRARCCPCFDAGDLRVAADRDTST